jgi:hypothetical protein
MNILPLQLLLSLISTFVAGGLEGKVCYKVDKVP